MTDLLLSLLRHLCTTVASTQVLVHPLPYAPTPVSGTSVRTAICDMPHDDSAHLGATTHNVVAHDSNTHGAVTSPTVLEDSNTHNSVTHSLVVIPSVSDQDVITDPTSYASIRNYSTQYPSDMSSTTTTIFNTHTVRILSSTGTIQYKYYSR